MIRRVMKPIIFRGKYDTPIIPRSWNKTTATLDVEPLHESIKSYIRFETGHSRRIENISIDILPLTTQSTSSNIQKIWIDGYSKSSYKIIPYMMSKTIWQSMDFLHPFHSSCQVGIQDYYYVIPIGGCVIRVLQGTIPEKIHPKSSLLHANYQIEKQQKMGLMYETIIHPGNIGFLHPSNLFSIQVIPSQHAYLIYLKQQNY